MSGAYHVKALPGQITIIALPPSAQTGIIKFGAVQLRLASDFGGAQIRTAVGNPDRQRPAGDPDPIWKIRDPLSVPTGEASNDPYLIARPFDEVASIVHYGQPGSGHQVSVLVHYLSGINDFAYHSQVFPGEETFVDLIPSAPEAGVRVFISLATDFEPAHVRFYVGRPNNWPIHEEDLEVPIGRKRIFETTANDQVASIRHISGNPVGVLVECTAPLG
jgi:hypothetical protein